MQFIVVTGMSGAGKSSAVHILEDIGYYCIDNIPPTLINNFITLCQNSNVAMDKIAFVVDARSGDSIMHLADEIDVMKKSGYNCEVLFLEANDEVIIKRYKETRRKHPGGTESLLIDNINAERRLLSKIRDKADYIINTSDLLTRQLREQILALFEAKQKYESINVSIVSFGFKRGIPLDSDLVFDVRFLPNPFYDSELKPQTGLDKPVGDYILQSETTVQFIEKLNDMVLYLLPKYADEGKMQVTISIGCTGGKHRSVFIAEQLKHFLKEKNYYTVITHRDLGQE